MCPALQRAWVASGLSTHGTRTALALWIITDSVGGMRNNIRTRKSLAVARLRYSKRDLALMVEFRNGGRYLYAQVSPDAWKRFRKEGKAVGYGKAVNTLIKPNHDFTKVG